jgi:O-antigen/teichoic acid export membrane protein
MVRSAGITAGLKIGSVLLAFVASLVYARALGPGEYGLYAYVIAWAALLAVPAGLGLPGYLLREGAKSPESVKNLLRWADKRLLLGGLAMGCVFAGGSAISGNPHTKLLFLVAAPLPLLSNLTYVRRSLVQALGRVARSQWPTLILAPGVTLAGIIVLWAMRGRID